MCPVSSMIEMIETIFPSTKNTVCYRGGLKKSSLQVLKGLTSIQKKIKVNQISFHFIQFQNELSNIHCTKSSTEVFFTTDSFLSISLVTWGSSWASKEGKLIKEFDFLGFSRFILARIEQSSKTSKIQPNCVILGCFFGLHQIP